MDLRDYLRVLRKGWPVIVGITLAAIAAGIGLTLATTKVYQANVQVFVAVSTSDTGQDLAQGQTFTQNRVQSYTAIANSPDVTGAVIRSLDLNLTQQQLADKITSDAPLNKVLINLHVTDNNPTTAARLANTVATQFNKVVEDTEQTDTTGQSVVKLTIIHPATVPTNPIKPNALLNIGLGVVLGLVLGVGLVVLRDVLDNTVKTPLDFTELDVAVLGMVPADKRAARMPISFRGDPHSLRSESYRQLRTNLQFVDIDNPPRVIAVTSAISGEGKSTTAMNLAAALAEAGQRVVLIEADLRRPTIAKSLGLVGEVGFTTVLIGRTTLEDALQNAGQNLAVLTSGPVPPNPSELLASEQASALIKSVAARADFVVIDTAPLLPVADGAEVAAIADATVVVHRAGKTTRDQVARSVAALDKVGRRPVGVVLNMLTRATGRYDVGYGYYYSYRPERGGSGRAETPADEARDLELARVPSRPADASVAVSADASSAAPAAVQGSVRRKARPRPIGSQIGVNGSERAGRHTADDTPPAGDQNDHGHGDLYAGPDRSEPQRFSLRKRD